MNTIYVNPAFTDAEMRQRLYDGDLLLYAPRPTTKALCSYAEQMIVEAFKGLDPKTAQYHMPVEEYVAIVAPLKPKFIHDPQTKVLIRNMLEDFGLSMD